MISNTLHCIHEQEMAYPLLFFFLQKTNQISCSISFWFYHFHFWILFSCFCFSFIIFFQTENFSSKIEFLKEHFFCRSKRIDRLDLSVRKKGEKL